MLHGIMAAISVALVIYLVKDVIKPTEKTVRSLDDVPRSKIRSAPQGYVELHGTARPFTNILTAPYSGKKCMYFFYRIQTAGRKTKVIHEDTAYTPFILEDETGTCLVDPEEADSVYPQLELHLDIKVKELPAELRDKVPWFRRTVHIIENLIEPGDRIVVTGQFKTYGKNTAALNLKEETKKVMYQLFRDKQSLLKKWDRDRDGKLDKAELKKLHAHAWKDALEHYQQKNQHYALHKITRPLNSRDKLLISVGDEIRLKRAVHYGQIGKFITAMWIFGIVMYIGFLLLRHF